MCFVFFFFCKCKNFVRFKLEAYVYGALSIHYNYGH